MYKSYSISTLGPSFGMQMALPITRAHKDHTRSYLSLVHEENNVLKSTICTYILVFTVIMICLYHYNGKDRHKTVKINCVVIQCPFSHNVWKSANNYTEN